MYLLFHYRILKGYLKMEKLEAAVGGHMLHDTKASAVALGHSQNLSGKADVE